MITETYVFIGWSCLAWKAFYAYVKKEQKQTKKKTFQVNAEKFGSYGKVTGKMSKYLPYLGIFNTVNGKSYHQKLLEKVYMELSNPYLA